MKLPLGTGTIDLDLPECDVTVAEPSGAEPVDVREAATTALSDPHGPPLSERVEPADDVAIVVTDLTRAVPDDLLLEAFLEELAGCGVGREQVTVVVGLGLHRPMTDDELEIMLGPHADLAVNHDPTAVVEVGTVDGCPVEIGEPVAAADTVLSTGVVEPHQYAGFSGGAKTVVVGAGSESLIRYTHGPEVLSREGVRLGRIDDNPFRNILDRAGDLAGVDVCLNLTHGPDGVLGVSAGDHRPVVSELADVARDALSVSVPPTDEYDAVVTGVGAPKDANLYQATRAATYVALGDRNPLGEDGRLVVPAALPEGVGDGTGERRFYDRLRTASDADALYREMLEGYEPGAQRAFVVARVLREHEVTVTNSAAPGLVEECLMRAEPTVADAVSAGSNVLVVPDALNTLLVDADGDGA
ncbi:lactate racemase domain-containing protein [Halobacteria archaeon AArc-m2/3/4]|uniref:Lactate racemase domain-containing protein n=1 Tax=Natronoglomus mannanivorans TaxID=2979990 RepID=A0ABT2QDR5_9EURY|nr:lactate racemase domain-containing protein [Halobacteria archaeon AArc-m2/3/4]